MKKILAIICLLTNAPLVNAQNTFPSTGSAGIGTSSPSASSLLEVKSTTKGVLIPRMTLSQRNAIAAPATALLIYQTNGTAGFYYYTGSAWTPIKNTAGWGLTGNSGTLPTTNFLGTTDAQPLLFKVNNQLSGTLDFNSSANTSYGYKTLLNNTGVNNTALGYQALNLNTTGGYNTAVGTYSLLNNSAGYQNTATGSNALISNQSGNLNCAIGYDALQNNTTGSGNVAIGNMALFSSTDRTGNVAVGDSALYSNGLGPNQQYAAENNTAIGRSALAANTTADHNTATGSYALYKNTTGEFNTATGSGALNYNTTGGDNTATGYGALFKNSTGYGNTAMGRTALYANTTGYYNTAYGTGALTLNTTGNYNTAHGGYSLFSNTTGIENTAIGFYSLIDNTTGSGNSAIGNKTLYYNTTGNENTAMGTYALYANTTGSGSVAYGAYALQANTTGSSNTAVGNSSLYANTTGSQNTVTGYGAMSSNTTGSYNAAYGQAALQNNTYGVSNVAIGNEALKLNTSGFANSALGNYALNANTTGYDNTASGANSLQNNTTGSENAALGYGTLVFNTTGSDNTANGFDALFHNTTGNNNTAVGYGSIMNNSSGSWNTCIGDNSEVSTTNLNGASAFGTSAITNADNKIVIGASGIASMVIGGYKAWSNLSDGRFKENVKENVPGLEFIKELRPVTYTVNVDKLQRHITAQMPDSLARHYYPTADAIAAAKKNIQTGFIAQEVEAAAKQIGYQFDGVNAPQNPTDNYSIAYSQFIPSLVKAVQQLDKDNSDLHAENAELKKQIQQMQECVNTLCGNNQQSGTGVNQIIPVIQIAPNPANGLVHVTIYDNDKIQNLTIKILDSSGKLIRLFTSETASATFEFDTSVWSKGIYTVQVLALDELLKSEKLVVQ